MNRRPPSDPFVPSFARYLETCAAYDAVEKRDIAEIDDDFRLIEDRFFAEVGRPPRIASAAGAAQALRHVIENDSIVDTFDLQLVVGVIAYLEGFA